MVDGTFSRILPIAILVAMNFVAGMTTSMAQEEGASGLTESQQARVLEEAVQILGGNANVIVRWNALIKFAVVGGKQQAQQMAHEVMLEVGEITGIPIAVLEHKLEDVSQYLAAVKSTPEFQLDLCVAEPEQGCSNFVLVFTDDKTMLSLAQALPMRDLYARSLRDALSRSESIPCFFSPFHIRNAEILQALVYVNENLPDDMLSTCLHEEIYQSFGLFADVTDSAYFSFDNRVVPKEITKYDQALLQAVYDSSLNPGAPVFAVLKVLLRNLAFDLYDADPKKD